MNIEDYRSELDSFIESHDCRMSDEEVVKKSLETEKLIFSAVKDAE